MNEATLFQNYLVVGAMLFAIGLVGFLARRNLIVMFLAAELMLQGVSVTLVAASRFHNDWGGQILVIFIIAIAACEAAIALALTLVVFHRVGSLDVAVWQSLREENQSAYVDREIPETPEDDEHWPSLTPAGNRPEVDPTQTPHRSHV